MTTNPISTELQHGHNMNVWQERGKKGAQASARQRSRIQKPCPDCGAPYFDLKRHEHSCKGVPRSSAPASAAEHCPRCGRTKMADEEVCCVCAGNGSRLDIEMARSRGISVAELREKLKVGRVGK